MTQHEKFRLLKDLKEDRLRLREIRDLTLDFPVDVEGIEFVNCEFTDIGVLRYCSFEKCVFHSGYLKCCLAVHCKFVEGIDAFATHFTESQFVDTVAHLENCSFLKCKEKIDDITRSVEGVFKNLYLARFKDLKPEWELLEIHPETFKARHPTQGVAMFDRKTL